jgi:hypothetical protein
MDVEPDHFSTDIAKAWIVREWACNEYGNFELLRYCDIYRECCVIGLNENKVMVWAKKAPEAICKGVVLKYYGHTGDCHPITLGLDELPAVFGIRPVIYRNCNL